MHIWWLQVTEALKQSHSFFGQICVPFSLNTVVLARFTEKTLLSHQPVCSYTQPLTVQRTHNFCRK